MILLAHKRSETVFLANLVFAQRFRAVGSSTVAFGANLLGDALRDLVDPYLRKT